MSTGAYGGRFTRNTFRRHFFQHLGFRVVNDEESTKVPIKLVNTEVFIVGSGAKGALSSRSFMLNVAFE